MPNHKNMQTDNEVVTVTENNYEFTPIPELLEMNTAAPLTNPDAQVYEMVEQGTQAQTMEESEIPVQETVSPKMPVLETAESEEEVIPEAGGEKPFEQGEEGKNDCITDTAETVKQIHEFHGMAEKSDADALLYNWEAGTRLNKLKESVEHGNWELFLKQNLPEISFTTIWRYRQLAKSFTLKDLTGLTLTDAYAKLNLAQSQDETSTGDGEGKKGQSSGKKARSSEAKLISTVAKAAKKFDAPTSLSQGEKTAVKKLCLKLEDVYGQVTQASILGLEWQVKIGKDLSDWTNDDVTIFTQDFAKLQKIQKDLELLEVEPGDIPQVEAAPLAETSPPLVPEPESVS